ncbi:hypothetical protein [Woodsholea maritima]|uniref:hypothetical protein n=1 Tax=Woodsholea maritima TaxID=240237 RepID=UPI00037072B0|nr:hypothetical protein [Woodsholea maritima]
MKKVLMAQAAVCAFILAACQNPAEQEGEAPAQDTQVTEQEDTNASETSQPEDPSSDDDSDEEGPSITALDQAARNAIEADDESFMNAIPEDSVFVERGANGIIRVACALNGERQAWVIQASQVAGPLGDALDEAVASEFRRGARPEDDRSQTGFYRRRDGGLGAVQRSPEAHGVCDIAREAHRQASVLPGHRVPG